MLRPSRQARLVGDGGLGHAQGFGDVAHAKPLAVQGLQDAHPGGVRKHLEQLGELIHLLGGAHGASGPLDGVHMQLRTFAGFPINLRHGAKTPLWPKIIHHPV